MARRVTGDVVGQPCVEFRVLGPFEVVVDGRVVTPDAPPLWPDALDAARFERLAAAGRRAWEAGDAAAAAGELTGALRLWRGEAYGEFGRVACRGRVEKSGGAASLKKK